MLVCSTDGHSDARPSILGLARAEHEVKRSASLVLVFSFRLAVGLFSHSSERFTSTQGHQDGKQGIIF